MRGGIYRPMVLTVPAVLRPSFSRNADTLLGPFMRSGARGLDDVLSHLSGKTRKGGYIVVGQTHGRNGQYHPHWHIIGLSGGLAKQAKCSVSQIVS